MKTLKTQSIFRKILDKHLLKNKVYLTSNELHTLFDACMEFISQLSSNAEDLEADDLLEVDALRAKVKDKILSLPLTGDRGELLEILWKHATNMKGDETYIPIEEMDSILDDILALRQPTVTDENINHLRTLMLLISARVDNNTGMTVSDLKRLWNSLSDIVTKLEADENN